MHSRLEAKICISSFIANGDKFAFEVKDVHDVHYNSIDLNPSQDERLMSDGSLKINIISFMR